MNLFIYLAARRPKMASRPPKKPSRLPKDPPRFTSGGPEGANNSDFQPKRPPNRAPRSKIHYLFLSLIFCIEVFE